MHFRAAQHAKYGMSTTTPIHRPRGTHRHTHRLLQVTWFSRVLQVLIGNKPFLGTRLRKAQIVRSDHPVDAAALFHRQGEERKIAYWRMNGVHTPIKWDKRGLHQFITGRWPLLRQLGWNRLSNVAQHILFLSMVSLPVPYFMGTF